ncbi:MAG TPA: DUF6448 family protein [Acidimicrobiales bacterium]|nr:DUF6448 family protein [Acidimicrobiales bacterium]
MPPHCDSLDGPVVGAARTALDTETVDRILAYVPASGEAELRRAFDLAISARTQGGAAREVADRFFFETAVRLHRAGEGAPYTGLKPAGLDVGEVIPLAEEAIAAGSADRLADFLADAVRRETFARFDAMTRAQAVADRGLDDARAYVEAMLGLQVWAHKLYGAVHAAAHEGAHEHA